jgi:hypothetical protein
MIFEDDLDRRNRVHCNYLMGLGLMGMGRTANAKEEFNLGLELDPNHIGLRTHLKLAER